METAQARPLTDATAPRPLRWRERLFVRLLRGLEGGSIRFEFPGGGTAHAGDPSTSPIPMRILRTDFFAKVFSSGSVGFGEAYVAGDWTTPRLTELLELLARNQRDLGAVGRGFSALSRTLNRLYHRARRNTLDRSRENIREHYDLSNAFYATFLDRSMTYSSALFRSPDETLEAAQDNKIARMLDLAEVNDGDRVLEIGSGWGAMAVAAARRGCAVRTVTLSEEQLAFAKERFAAEGVADCVGIALEDYRSQEGHYDAILSCEMIEAVGHEYLDEYFRVIRRCLKPGGRAVIQVISIPDERYERYCRSCDWIQKHIFPGGHLPSPGALGKAVSAAGGLVLLGSEGFGHDYAETLRRWRERFNTAHAKVEALGFDASFRRKWNYYLSYCEAGFRADMIDVKHVVIERV